MIDNANSQAFPIQDFAYGLTKRELIAAMALQKLAVHLPLAGMVEDGLTREKLSERIAKECVCYADALLAELEKKV